MTNEEANEYIRLVYYAMKNFPNYKNKEDLYQAGWVGLMKASKTYDASFETKFSTYAYPFIQGEMYRLVEKDKVVKSNLELEKLSLKISKAKILLTQKLMKEPSINELADFLEVREEDIVEAIHYSEPVASLQYATTSDSKELYLEDIIPAKEYDIDKMIELRDALNELSEEDKKILMYNMYKNQTEVGKIFNMSQVKVSRRLTKIKNQILDKVA